MIKFPPHEASLELTHNEHKSNYETVAQHLDWWNDDERYDWVSDEQKQKAIDTNDFWSIRWYPDTPVAFLVVAAADLDVLMKFVNKEEV